MSRVSIRYAKAFFAFAVEENKLDRAAEDLTDIKSLIAESKEFAVFMTNPLISRLQQEKILYDIFINKVDNITLNFLQFICQKKRLNKLAEIIDSFEILLLKQRNQLHAEITSADTLDIEQVRAIQSNLEKMTSKSILLKSKTDPSLIGGFKIFVEGMIIDNSIQNQLQKLKEKLIA